jgi:hypothetical protein
MNTHQSETSTRTGTTRKGIKRRLAVGAVVIAAFASFALPNAGLAADNQSLASQGTLKLPPGWCYYEPFGGYHPCANVTIKTIWLD